MMNKETKCTPVAMTTTKRNKVKVKRRIHRPKAIITNEPDPKTVKLVSKSSMPPSSVSSSSTSSSSSTHASHHHSNLIDTSLLSPIDTSDRKRKMSSAVSSSLARGTAKAEQLMQDIEKPTENDVLMGRGGKNNQWHGNEKLRQVARTRAHAYAVASKREKSQISRELVDAIRSLSPPGRFLRKCPNSKWEDVGDEIAREKTSQVLRDAIQAKKSFSGDSPTIIMGLDRRIKRETTSSHGQVSSRTDNQRGKPAADRIEPSSMDRLPRAPSSPYRHPSHHQYPYPSATLSPSYHHRTPAPVVTGQPDWRARGGNSYDHRPYYQPVSADSTDSVARERSSWWNQQYSHYYSQPSGNPYGYQPAGQYYVTPATTNPTSDAPRKRPRYQQSLPTGYNFSPQNSYHSFHTADTPPVAAMYSPPNARMQVFSPASAAPIPSLSSNPGYSGVDMVQPGPTGTGRYKSKESSNDRSNQYGRMSHQGHRSTQAGRDSWINDVPQFTLSTSTKSGDTKRRPQLDDQRTSPPSSHLALYQEDLLSDSEHDGKDRSISPMNFAPDRL